MSIQAVSRRPSGVRLALVSVAVTALALGPGVTAASSAPAEFVRLGKRNDEKSPTSIFNQEAQPNATGLEVQSFHGLALLASGQEAGLRAFGKQDGVQATSFNKDGSGVLGLNSAGGIGVRGIASGGVGVSGEFAKVGVSGSGSETGVVGAGDTGVLGRGNETGVTGRSFNENGSGVWGLNFLSGPFAIGVRGNGNIGLFGEGRKTGVSGEGVETGVIGTGPNGVEGVSESEDGSGVLGRNSASSALAFGVKGVGNTGVLGEGKGTGVLGRGDVTGVVGRSKNVGVFGLGEGVGVHANGPVALETHGKLNFDRSGVIRIPQNEASRKACGFELTPDSLVIATIQGPPVVRVGDRDEPLAVGGFANEGCVTVVLSHRADMPMRVAFLILN